MLIVDSSNLETSVLPEPTPPACPLSDEVIENPPSAEPHRGVKESLGVPSSCLNYQSTGKEIVPETPLSPGKGDSLETIKVTAFEKQRTPCYMELRPKLVPATTPSWADLFKATIEA